jgi:anhydro-N-acetylmuramic acid kinase
MDNTDLYIGLMSGTSLDAIDVAIIGFGTQGAAQDLSLVATKEHAFPVDLQQALLQIIENPDSVSLDQIGTLHRQLGLTYAQAVNTLLTEAGIGASEITAIGCHGQTVRHSPDTDPAFTLQLGDGATIANGTGITTVNDFRSADIALGGQGAPLAPGFHKWLYGQQQQNVAVVNIGGIANITLLHADGHTSGFDTGPGNTLLDSWINKHQKQKFDAAGAWAGSGQVDKELLALLLSDPYFAMPAPKSTGREYFHTEWLASRLAGQKPVNVQATLAELTACSIATAIQQYSPVNDVHVCGGGALNHNLLQRLQALLPASNIQPVNQSGVSPEWVEAIAFGWLARERLAGNPAGLPDVTGATQAALLGAVHLPPK